MSFFILLWILVLSHSLETVSENFPQEFDFRYTSYEGKFNKLSQT